MTVHLSTSGTIGTDPEFRHVGAQQNLARLTFRFATSERYVDQNGQWHDKHTNWFSVTAFGKLAENARGELCKGQRILVSGKLRISNYERGDKTMGTNVEILANRLGPDLSVVSVKPEPEQAPEQHAPQHEQQPQQQPAQQHAVAQPEWSPSSTFVPDDEYETEPAF